MNAQHQDKTQVQSPVVVGLYRLGRLNKPFFTEPRQTSPGWRPHSCGWTGCLGHPHISPVFFLTWTPCFAATCTYQVQGGWVCFLGSSFPGGPVLGIVPALAINAEPPSSSSSLAVTLVVSCVGHVSSCPEMACIAVMSLLSNSTATQQRATHVMGSVRTRLGSAEIASPLCSSRTKSACV